jgi:D-alanine-D-alanine ligase
MSKLSNQRIALLKGGPGSEREVSLASATGVAGALRELGATVVEIDARDADFEIPPDVTLVFNIIHGTFGEDGQLQEILERRGVPYTGEGVEGSRMAFDKIETKKRFVERSVPTPHFEIIKADARPSLPIPYVVKAPRQGSSVGVSVVKTAGQVDAALRECAQYDEVLLVEKYIEGRELTVGILGDTALPIIEICPAKDFYNFKNKYPFLNPQGGGGANHFCPAPLDEKTTRLVQQVAIEAHRALDLEVYSRVDVLLSADKRPFVLEINTIPGMTQASLLPEAAAAAGIGYAELCGRIIELSLAKRRHS